MPKPDFVHCVALRSGAYINGKRTWCGSDELPYFLDAQHAAYYGARRGRLVACPDCVAAIVAGLRNGHEDASETITINGGTNVQHQ